MKVRIKDIARLAQVSPGTVDRVIHHRGEVSEKTREKIEIIIKELNYQPDILARTLASKKSWLFVVLMPVSVNGNDFWQAPLRGIEKAEKEIAHYGIRVHRMFFDMYSRESFLQTCSEVLKEKPDALLFAPIFPAESFQFAEQCRKNKIPLILFNSNLDDIPDICFIGQDAIQSGKLAGKLLSWGLKSPGDILIFNLAGRKDNHNHILRREMGFRSFFAENNYPGFNLHTIELTQPDEKVLTGKIRELSSSLRLKGLFVTNSRVGMLAKCIQDLQDSGIRLIGYDLLPDNVEWLKKGVIDFLISQKPEEQGYLGIVSLFNEVILGRQTPKNQFIPIDIITKENIDYYEIR